MKEIWPLSKNYDLIIIDGPARTSTGTLEIAKKADLVVQPTGASRANFVPSSPACFCKDSIWAFKSAICASFCCHISFEKCWVVAISPTVSETCP